MSTSIKDCAVPPESISDFEEMLTDNRPKYRSYFVNNDQYELFMMLPATDDLRMRLLRVMSESKIEDRKLFNCPGVIGSSPEHRRHCIKCVCTERCDVAKSLF